MAWCAFLCDSCMILSSLWETDVRSVQRQVTMANVNKTDPLTQRADRLRSCRETTELTTDCQICRDSLNLCLNSSDSRSSVIGATGTNGGKSDCCDRIQGSKVGLSTETRSFTASLLWCSREQIVNIRFPEEGRHLNGRHRSCWSSCRLWNRIQQTWLQVRQRSPASNYLYPCAIL